MSDPDRLSTEIKDLVSKTYSYVEGSHELRHVAAAVAFLYRTSLHGSCPGFAPRSNISNASLFVEPHYNPRGMKPLNSMLRHAHNFFRDIYRPFNFEDSEAREHPGCAVFFRARSICATLSEAFTILVEGGSSRSKGETASRLSRYISDFIISSPRTRVELRVAEAEERRRVEAAAAVLAAEEAKREAEVKVLVDAARAEADRQARAAGFASAADVW